MSIHGESQSISQKKIFEALFCISILQMIQTAIFLATFFILVSSR